ncbi:MAG: hypothetical protein WBC42_13195 [Candidatus Zixiibacteriota bacterium]
MPAYEKSPLTPVSGGSTSFILNEVEGLTTPSLSRGGIFDLSLSPRGEGNGHVIASAAKQSHEEIAAPFGLAMTLHVYTIPQHREISLPAYEKFPLTLSLSPKV